MSQAEHRRKSRRYPLRWKAAVVFDAEQKKPVVQTRTQDLSVIGAAIYTEHGDLTGAMVTLLLAYPARTPDEVPKVLRVRARVVSSERSPGTPRYRHGLSFVRPPDEGVDDLEAILRDVEAAPPPEKPPPVVAAAPGGVLARLKELAKARQDEGRTADPQDVIDASVSDALATAYRYLKDFAEQLNVIHPAFPKGYAIVGVPEFNGLSWVDGQADFHMRELSPLVKLYDRVSLRFRLSGEKQIRVVRDYPASEKLRQWLADCDIEFKEQTAWGARNAIERTTFFFPCEVRAKLVLSGRYDMGKLLLRMSNVSGFGAMDQLIAPEAVSEDSLDELGLFILGEASRLGPLLLRNA